MKKIISGITVMLVAVIALPAIAFAHVIVTPGRAGVGQELVFSVSVPNERDSAVTMVKLLVPSGVQEVTPTIVPGFTISTDGSDDNVTAITWAGSIPVGQREDFSFGAQVPAKAGQLDWKAYQTYADGTVVHWDQKPAGSDDATGNAGPYSVTNVVDDLNANTSTTTASDSGKTTFALVLGTAALVFSVVALLLKSKK